MLFRSVDVPVPLRREALVLLMKEKGERTYVLNHLEQVDLQRRRVAVWIVSRKAVVLRQSGQYLRLIFESSNVRAEQKRNSCHRVRTNSISCPRDTKSSRSQQNRRRACHRRRGSSSHTRLRDDRISTSTAGKGGGRRTHRCRSPFWRRWRGGSACSEGRYCEGTAIEWSAS